MTPDPDQDLSPLLAVGIILLLTAFGGVIALAFIVLAGLVA